MHVLTWNSIFTNVHKQQKKHHNDRNMVMLIFLYQKVSRKDFEIISLTIKIDSAASSIFWLLQWNFQKVKCALQKTAKQLHFACSPSEISQILCLTSISHFFHRTALVYVTGHAQYVLLGRCARDLLQVQPVSPGLQEHGHGTHLPLKLRMIHSLA